MRNNSSLNLVVIKGDLDKETSKAILIKDITAILYENEDYISEVSNENALAQQWFPFSQVSKIYRNPAQGEDELHVSSWICKQKGLI